MSLLSRPASESYYEAYDRVKRERRAIPNQDRAFLERKAREGDWRAAASLEQRFNSLVTPDTPVADAERDAEKKGLQRENEALRRQVEGLGDRLEVAKNRIDELQSKGGEGTGESDGTGSSGSQAELAQANAELRAKDRELAQANAELRAKDRELAQANANLQKKDRELAQANTALQAKNAELELEKTAMQAKGEELAQANASLAAKNEELERANAASSAQPSPPDASATGSVVEVINDDYTNFELKETTDAGEIVLESEKLGTLTLKPAKKGIKRVKILSQKDALNATDASEDELRVVYKKTGTSSYEKQNGRWLPKIGILQPSPLYNFKPIMNLREKGKGGNAELNTSYINEFIQGTSNEIDTYGAADMARQAGSDAFRVLVPRASRGPLEDALKESSNVLAKDIQTIVAVSMEKGVQGAIAKYKRNKTFDDATEDVLDELAEFADDYPKLEEAKQIKFIADGLGQIDGVDMLISKSARYLKGDRKMITVRDAFLAAATKDINKLARLKTGMSSFVENGELAT